MDVSESPTPSTSSSAQEPEVQGGSSSSSGTLTPAEPNQEDVLEAFRRQWRSEVDQQGQTTKAGSSQGAAEVTFEEDDEEEEDEEEQKVFDQAKELFLKGAELEREGQHFLAIQKYKRAVQLVPDIEYRTFEAMRRKDYRQKLEQDEEYGRVQEENANETNLDNNNPEDIGDHEELADLAERFSHLSASSSALCQPEEPVTGSSHIGVLPMELLILILKWAVSKELDVRSLERASAVCRGFYMAARSSDIWRLICFNTWGLNSLPLRCDDWRAYFLRRPRVLLPGCYIAKMSYVREGERNFQDNEFYRSWHLVKYFRYLRFFSEGRVTMLTSADEPRDGVRILAAKFGVNAQGAVHGHYRVASNRVAVVLKRSAADQQTERQRYRRRRGQRGRQQDEMQSPDQEFRFELEIVGKRWRQLRWLRYDTVYLYPNGRSVTSAIDVTNSANFPNMAFSGVLSYDGKSESLLA